MMRIKQFREAQGLRQQDLAEKAGVSRSYLAEMESGSKTINNRRLEQVAQALGVAARDLFEEDDEVASAMAELSAIVRRVSPRDLDLILGVARSTARGADQARERKKEGPSETET